ncbi:MAG TPA: pseudouridine synthase [Candidatus Angelobacter sp.]
MSQERLQKIVAAAGIASRRNAEALISQGRVTVNGQVISELGSKADPERDHIKVDGKLLRVVERHTYLLLNKPRGYVTTVSDPEGRPTVMSLLHHVPARVYPVGRLDYASEGLLLLTNDGELANKLTRAASHVPKTYVVKISGRASEEDVARLRGGIRLRSTPRPASSRPGQASGKPEHPGRRGLQAVHTAPAQVRLIKDAANPWYEVTLIEGRNRQIRRMFEEIGHHVEKIRRVGYGPLQLDVEPGQFRELTPREVESLRRSNNDTQILRRKDAARTSKGNNERRRKSRKD